MAAKRTRALELDDTSVRTKQKRDEPADLYEPDIPPSPAGPTPAARPVMLELTGERLSFIAFVLEMRKALPTEASLSDVHVTSFGYRVRTRYVEEVTAAAEKLGFVVGAPPPRCNFVHVRVENVPRPVSEDELLEDLQRHLRSPRFVRSVRRLFASTEGRADRERPLPVIYVTIASSVLERLQSWRLFGAVELRVSSRPQREVDAPQCPRCLDWGHRAGACRNPRRCAVCGKADHLALDCSKREEPRRCFQCGGAHSSRYRGCKARSAEVERIRVLSSVPRFDQPAAVAGATGFAPPPLSYSAAVTGACPALEDASTFPLLEHQPQLLPTPLPPAAAADFLLESRTETSRARAELLLQHTQALERLNAHLARLDFERTSRPARALTRVVSRFRRQRAHHRQRLAVLNRERILADAEAATPSPWRGRPLNVTFVSRQTGTEDLVAAPEPAKAISPPATADVGTSTELLPEPMSVAYSDVPVPVASLVPVPVANLVPVPVANASTSTEPQPVASTSSAQAASTSVDEALATILSALRLRPSTASIAPVVEQLVFRALLSGVDPDEVDDLTLDDLSDSELEELARIYRN